MQKERIIFDTYDVDRTSIAEYLFEDKNENDDWDTPNDVPDDLIDFELDNEQEYVFSEISKFFNGDNEYILMGEVGTWKGPRKAGFVFSKSNELFKVWKDCDYIKLYDVDGHFYIKCSHHDGTNYYEVKELTQKGIDYLEGLGNPHDREIHEKIWNSNFFSRLPHYAHKVFGVPKKEKVA